MVSPFCVEILCSPSWRFLRYLEELRLEHRVILKERVLKYYIASLPGGIPALKTTVVRSSMRKPKPYRLTRGRWSSIPEQTN